MIPEKTLIATLLIAGIGLICGHWGARWDGYSDAVGLWLGVFALILWSECY